MSDENPSGSNPFPLRPALLRCRGFLALAQLPGEVLDEHIEQLLTELISYFIDENAFGYQGYQAREGQLVGIDLLHKVSLKALRPHVCLLVRACTAESAFYSRGSSCKSKLRWACLEQLTRLDWHTYLDRLAPVILRTYLIGNDKSFHGEEATTFNAMRAVVEMPKTLATQTALALGYLFTESMLQDARKDGLETIINEIGMSASAFAQSSQQTDRACRLLSLVAPMSLQPHAAVLVWLLGALQGKTQAAIYKHVIAIGTQSFGSDVRLVLRCVRSRCATQPTCTSTVSLSFDLAGPDHNAGCSAQMSSSARRWGCASLFASSRRYRQNSV